MKFRCPTTASSSERLFCGVGCPPLSGSAPRLFQPLSGFRKLEFHGLVSCRNRSWTTSYRAFPSRRPCSPSRDQLLPCCHRPVCGYASLATLSPPISPTPALLTQLPGSLDDYELPFHQPEGQLPGHPGSPAAGSSPTTSFTSFEVLSPP